MAKAKRWNVVAACLAALTSAVALFAPLGTGSTVDGSGITSTTHVSLLTTEGPRVLIVLAIPVMLVLLPLALGGQTATYRARFTIVILLSIFTLLGALTVGLFFIPTLFAMCVSQSAHAAARMTPPTLMPPPPPTPPP